MRCRELASSSETFRVAPKLPLSRAEALPCFPTAHGKDAARAAHPRDGFGRGGGGGPSRGASAVADRCRSGPPPVSAPGHAAPAANSSFGALRPRGVPGERGVDVEAKHAYRDWKEGRIGDPKEPEASHVEVVGVRSEGAVGVPRRHIHRSLATNERDSWG